MSFLNNTTYRTKTESPIRLHKTEDIQTGLLLTGLAIRFKRDKRGKLWVTGQPLKMFARTAQALLRARGYSVSQKDLRDILLALAYQAGE